MFSDLQTKVAFNMIEDDGTDKEIKLNLILELMYHDHISLNKARELCTENGLFSNHWVVVDAQTSEKFEQQMIAMKDDEQ